MLPASWAGLHLKLGRPKTGRTKKKLGKETGHSRPGHGKSA